MTIGYFTYLSAIRILCILTIVLSLSCNMNARSNYLLPSFHERLVMAKNTFQPGWIKATDSSQNLHKIASEIIRTASKIDSNTFSNKNIDSLNEYFENPNNDRTSLIKSLNNTGTKLMLYMLFHNNNLDKNYTDKLIMLNNNIKLMSLFVNDGTLIDFSKSKDPAIILLRDDIKLVPPSGFAYVISGPKYSMIDNQNKNEIGETIFCRYICMKPYIPINIQTETGSGINAKYLSHELVHAYICALLGNKRYNLPTWFHEGAALYFADNNPFEFTGYKTTDHSFNIYYRKLTEDYKKYKIVFIYLRHIHGKERFREFMRESINDASINRTLLSLLGHQISNFNQLYKEAFNWYIQINILKTVIIVWIGLLLVLLWNIQKLYRNELIVNAKNARKLMYLFESKYNKYIFVILVVGLICILIWPVTRTIF